MRPVTVGAETQQALRDDIADYLEDVYLEIDQQIHDSITFDSIELFNVTEGVPEPSINWPTLTVGGDATAPVPDGVTALSIGRTGVSKVVGKKYWPLGVETDIVEGIWGSTPTGVYALAAADWIAPFTGASGVTWDPGVWSRAAALFRVFTETATSSVPAYQRRRKRGVGS